MSVAEPLLFLWPGADGRRLRFGGEGEAATVLVVPGEDVAIHWIDLPALAPAQARAAARLIAADISATPVADLHVAVGMPEEDGRSAMAVISRDRMAALLATASGQGIDPVAMVPEPLLLGRPDAGVALLERDGMAVLRGPELAASAEPDLAAALLDGAPVSRVSEKAFEAALPDAWEKCPMDLRQGEFAPRRAWLPDGTALRRAGFMLAGALVLMMAAPIVSGTRYQMATGELEKETGEIARAALPSEIISDPTAQLAERLVRLRGEGRGYVRTSDALFTALRQTPAVRLTRLGFTDGTMQFDADGIASDIALLTARIEASGFTVSYDPVRSGGVASYQLTMRLR
jgi:general secretion pathway protein L